VCKLRMLTAPNAGQIGKGGSPRSRFSTYPWSSFPGRVITSRFSTYPWSSFPGRVRVTAIVS